MIWDHLQKITSEKNVTKCHKHQIWVNLKVLGKSVGGRMQKC